MQGHHAVFEEHHLIEHTLDIRDQMGGQQYGRILAVIGQDRVKDVVARRGVHAADRLVEQEQLRLAAHGQDELHLFLGALGQRLEAVQWADIQRVQHVVCLDLVKVRVKVRKKVDQVADLHPVVQVGTIRQIADHAVRVDAGRRSVDRDRAAGRLEQPVEQFDGRGLARTVRPQQADEPAPLKRQVEVVERLDAAVNLGQPLTDNQFISLFHFRCPPLCVSPKASLFPVR